MVLFEPPQQKRRAVCLRDVWSDSIALKVTVNDKLREMLRTARDFGFQGPSRHTLASMMLLMATSAGAAQSRYRLSLIENFSTSADVWMAGT